THTHTLQSHTHTHTRRVRNKHCRKTHTCVHIDIGQYLTGWYSYLERTQDECPCVCGLSTCHPLSRCSGLQREGMAEDNQVHRVTGKYIECVNACLGCGGWREPRVECGCDDRV